MSGGGDRRYGWVERVLGVTRQDLQRRKDKVTSGIAEIGVQASVLDDLGYGTDAGTLRTEKQRLTGDYRNVAQGRDRKTAFDRMGELKREARGAVPVVATKNVNVAARAALAKLLETVGEEIQQSDDGRQKTRQEGRLTRQQQDAAAFDDDTPLADIAKAEKSALSLLNDALKAGYSGKYRRDMIPDQRNKAYGKMIKERYGVKVDFSLVPDIDLSLLYEALAVMPQEHVKTDSLTNIKISAADDALGDYDKTAKRIRIDVAKVKERPKMEYKVDGGTKKLDTMSVVTAHEVGHAVDDKAKIMASPGHESYGGWTEDIKVEDVVDAYWESVKSGIDAVQKQVVLDELKNALEGKTFTRPPSLSDGDWNAAKGALLQCQKVGLDKTPWKTPHALGDVVYHFTYGKWFSYSKKARDAVTVRDYQWRAPGEWFAELYAVSWVTKKKPAGAVNSNAARFMYREQG